LDQSNHMLKGYKQKSWCESNKSNATDGSQTQKYPIKYSFEHLTFIWIMFKN
jgi:hypothetical protein